MMLLDQYGKPIDTKALAAARRVQDRAKRMDSLSASYDAAANTAETSKHWRYADNLSAAAANSVSVRKTLRERSRYECMENNSFAKGVVLTLANDCISTGPSLQVMLPDTTASRMIEAKWRKWAKDVRLASKLRTARIAKVIDGETVILKGNNPRSKNDVKLDLRVIECDQLATPYFADGLPNKVDGIEFDDFGNPTVYHILKGHPGDRWPLDAFEKEDVDPDDIIHLFRAERPGQMRGIPELTPALPLFAMLRRYTLAVITAAENAADFSAILKTQSNAFDSASDGIDDIDPFDFVQIDRGLMTSLPKGWEMVQFDPKQPVTTYTEFRNAILGEIARCVHMPKNKVLADSSGYNYSSGRLDHQTYHESVAIERSQWWEIEALDRIFGWWLDEALLMDGYLPAIEPTDEIPKVWRWPPQRDVNPAEIADVNIELIRAGLKTRQQYLIEQNIDPEAHAQQLVEEGWVNPDRPPAPAGAAPGAPSASGAPGAAAQSTGAAEPDPSQPAPTGEFANMSRLQLTRNWRAIEDTLGKIEEGIWTTSRARVFLGSLGLKESTINNLVSEYEEQPA
jgi:lambda family phage portal protein